MAYLSYADDVIAVYLFIYIYNFESEKVDFIYQIDSNHSSLAANILKENQINRKYTQK